MPATTVAVANVGAFPFSQVTDTVVFCNLLFYESRKLFSKTAKERLP